MVSSKSIIFFSNMSKKNVLLHITYNIEMTEKMIVWVAVLAFSCFSCGHQSQENKTSEQQQGVQVVKDEYGIVEIKTEEDFRTTVAMPEHWDSIKYQQDKPCIIDFYATWCAPCKQLAPIYEKLAQEYMGKIVFYRIDVDVLPNLSLTLGIEGMPTLLLFKKGQNEQMLGFLGQETENQLRQKLDNLLVK